MIVWTADSQIKTSGGTPQSDDAPQIAVDGSNRLSMVYRGSGGSNLWWAWCDNKSGTFSDWQGNAQIMVGGIVAATTSARPALTLFRGFLTLFYITPNKKAVECLRFDGNQWNAMWFPGLNTSNDLTSLSVYVGYRLNMVILDAKGTMYQLEAIGDLATGPSAWNEGLPTTGWAYADIWGGGGETLYLTGVRTTDPNHTVYATVGAASGNWFPGTPTGMIETALGSPQIQPGSLRLVKDGHGNLFAMYIGQGGQTLYIALFGQVVNSNLLLQASEAAQTQAGVVLKTNQPPSIYSDAFHNCLVHKANSSNYLYLAYGPR